MQLFCIVELQFTGIFHRIKFCLFFSRNFDAEKKTPGKVRDFFHRGVASSSVVVQVR